MPPADVVERTLARLLRAIARGKMFRRLLVVAGQRLVSLVRDALTKRFEIKDSEQ